MLWVKVLYKGQIYTAYLKLSGKILYKTKPINSFNFQLKICSQYFNYNLKQLNNIINT